jgi:hypothetical protein
MRNKFLIFCFSLCLTTLMAQSVPQAFKYQSVIRDANGNTMVNKPVKIQFKLSQYTGANLVAVYTETQAATTTKIGLINLNVGKGTVVLGNFSQPDWSKPTFLNIGVDIAGGNNFTDLGAAELLSVPYALYSANGDIKQTLSQSGTNVTLSNGGGTISINDADASPTNEIEMPTDAVAGDISYYNGTSWKRVPAGATGTVLTMGIGGKPFWQTPPQLDSLIKVTMTNGDVIYVHSVDNSVGVVWGSLGIDIAALVNFTTAAAANMDFSGEASTVAIVA